MSGPVQVYPPYSPWWSPWGFVMRVPHIVKAPSDLVWIFRIGWFVVRVPGDLERSNVAEFLTRMRRAARPAAGDHAVAVERVVRLRSPWLHLPRLRARDTCYLRALTVYRFVDASGHDVRFKVGAEWFDNPGGVLRGHAWVTIDGETVEEPPGIDDHAKLQPIELLPRDA